MAIPLPLLKPSLRSPRRRRWCKRRRIIFRRICIPRPICWRLRRPRPIIVKPPPPPDYITTEESWIYMPPIRPPPRATYFPNNQSWIFLPPSRPDICAARTASVQCGWKPYKQHLYYVFTKAETWYVAEYKCRQYGGHMVSIEDKAEQQFLRSVYSNPAWIGLYRDASQHWTWTDRTPFVYKHWDGSYRSPTQHRCAMQLMTSMRWRAADCSQPMLFVCKVPMQTVRRPPLPQGQQFLVGVCNVYHLPPTDSRAPLAALCVDRRQTRFIIPNIFFVPKGHRQPPIYVDMARLPEQDLPIPSSLLPVGHAEITWSPTGKRYFFTFKKYKGDIRPSIPIIFFARPRPPVGWKWPTKQMNTISPGWKPHGLHYCRMFSIKTTWFQANAVCRMFGGNLASTAYCAERDIVNQRRRQTIWVSRNMDSDRIETPPYDARPLHHGKPSCRKWINGARTVDSENCYEMLPFVCVTRFVPRLKQPLAPFPFSVPFPLPFYVRPLLPLSDGYNPGDSTILEPPIPAAIPSTNNFTPIRLPPVSGYMHTSPGPRVIWPTSRKVPNISLPPSGQTPSPLLPRREPQYLVAVCNVYKVPLMDPRAPYVAFCTDSRQTHFVIPNLFFVPRGQPQPPFYVDMSRMPCQNPNPLLWQSAGYAEITWHTDRKYFLMTFRNTKSEVLPSTWLIFFAKQTRPNGLANQVHTTNAPGWTRFNGNFYKIFQLKTSWQQAESVCQMFGGNLAAVQNPTEQMFIKRITTQEVWVGLRKINRNMWQWASGPTIRRISISVKVTGHNEYPLCVKLSTVPVARYEAVDCTRMLPFVCKVSFTPRTQLPPSPFPFPGLFLSPFDQRPNLHVQQPHWLINIQVPLPPIRAKPLTVQLKNGERIPVAKCDIYEPKYKSSLPGLHNIAICNSTSGKEIVLTNIVFTHGQLREQTSIDAFFMSCPIRRDQLRKSSRNGYEITRSSKQKRFYLKGGTAGDIPLDIFAYPTRSNGRKEVTVTEFVQESHSVSTSKRRSGKLSFEEVSENFDDGTTTAAKAPIPTVRITA